MEQNPFMRKVALIAAIALAVLHQDFWLWDNGTLVFGFLPAGLAYHMFYSVTAGALWAFTVFFAWPYEIEEEVERELGAPPEQAK